ncbi:two-component system, sensor histidine kinase YesM [Anaerocolumna jejuensis DSM 15929]|uniref:histidine kinase n=1 Tax=Anaerocolumna jejuensis DSM 15929 TaxID=1121322 RepID=A0A1M6QA50_9FIRM|nr:histidine kinase [Anaerocolumna jejuensis]SHK16963.1 two-component system, sensor histidine kinase YesM [Anaerocolumna jejuensis DSM 15929]
MKNRNNIFKINTLKKRFFLILGVGMVLGLFLVIFVSYLSLKAIEKTKIETSLVADLKEMSDSIDSDYYTLLQISQQMISLGSIGNKFNQYLVAESQYDKIDLYKQFSESVNIAVFGSKDVLLAAYFVPDSANTKVDKMLFSNFMVDKSFNPEAISRVLDTNQIGFQVMHTSNISVIEKNVLSIIRPTFFDNGTQAMIYVEAYSDILDSVEHRSELQHTHYAFLQLNTENEVCFSNSKEYEVGKKIEVLHDRKINIGGYVGVAKESSFGFTNILLMPEADYRREMNNWLISIAVVILITLGIITTTTTLLIWLIYRPIKTLQKEMEHFGDGNFAIENYSFNIEEFDSLFHTFNNMKRQIKSLMDESCLQEKQKAQLELDKLYYQINPHFLMNTLNSVHWMAVTNNQPEIDAFINRLNYILGYSLGKTDRRSTLRTEIKSLKMYLDLQKMKYDFDYDLDVEEGEYLDKDSARFILQPIAENAVCHNMDEFGHLWVTIKQRNQSIVITIKDDGKGFVLSEDESGNGEESRKNKGIGIRYVKMTLEAFYGEATRMRIESRKGTGTVVEMILPCNN